MKIFTQIPKVLVLVFFFSTPSFCQNEVSTLSTVSATKFENQIKEIYGLEWMSINADAVVVLMEALTNRVTYLHEPLTSNDKYPLLSSFPLMNRNNPSIVEIDYSAFDTETFNPLSYHISMFSDLKQVVRVDGTDYIIVVDPIKRK